MIKTRQATRIISGLIGMMIMTAMILLFQVPAHGFVCPASETGVDTDGDGVSDYLECTGFPFYISSVTTFSDGTPWTQPLGYTVALPQITTLPRKNYLDPTSKDLFVIVQTVNINGTINDTYTIMGTMPPYSLLDLITATQASNGLGIGIHVIPFASVGPMGTSYERQVTATVTVPPSLYQKAIILTESMGTTDPTILGIAQYGTPDTTGSYATIFTQKIKNFIDTTCSNLNNICQDSTGTRTRTSSPSIYDVYIKQTFNHEAGHNMGLTTTLDSKIGNHYASTSTTPIPIMEQFVYYKDTGTRSTGPKITWYLPTSYTTADKTGFRLK